MGDLSNFLLAAVIIAAFVLMFCGCIAIIFVSPDPIGGFLHQQDQTRDAHPETKRSLVLRDRIRGFLARRAR
ncbi:hypothetical protein PQH03_06820 [Ralstonia insidiosa]|uniref:hypothetical protein n=1 Tax=Ralstonia insidiosa TaxID=190721 RepID=UPI0020663B1E|nr:hypothetical protein [Ralstonia insidiosa]MDE4924337.1 hypothetical protein [Ralstonia insidiosa]UNJ99880.1 hypothetical protein MMB19_14255 [Ralstonia insidiosa]